ncbi:MAG: hypothetical protein ACFFG0_09240 [Candidatus Thorarchaeota archaeon]
MYVESEIDWKKIAKQYYDIAVWFASHDPGTPVPDWCFLAWPPIEIVEEIRKLKLKETYFSIACEKQLNDIENRINKLRSEIGERIDV